MCQVISGPYSVELAEVSVFMPTPCCLDHYNHVVYVEVSVMLLDLLGFARDCFGYVESL